MPPKPRQTLARPSQPPRPSTNPTSSYPSSASPAPPQVKRRRWFHSKPTLILLLLLQPSILLFAFILLTEPCLNPSFKPSLWDKRNYLTLLSTPGAIPQGEWKARFRKAGLRALFGSGVVQCWFVARLNGYVQRASLEHERILTALRQGGKVKTDEGNVKGKGVQVGSFIRQLESVSLTLLGLPFIIAAFYLAIVLAGAPLWEDAKATLIVATQLSLLIGLPLVHVLGLPALESDPLSSNTNTTAPTSNTKNASTIATEPAEATKSNFYSVTSPTPASSPASSTSNTSIPNTSRYWISLLTLKPNPTFLLPLYYPFIFTVIGTIASTAVLALDWQVSYQTFPYPLLVGSLLGLAIGNLYTICIVLLG